MTDKEEIRKRFEEVIKTRNNRVAHMDSINDSQEIIDFARGKTTIPVPISKDNIKVEEVNKNADKGGKRIKRKYRKTKKYNKSRKGRKSKKSRKGRSRKSRKGRKH
jgi:hypothetical protein